MDLILGSAGQLKPEVRLGQAVAKFEALLSREQKAAFEAGRLNARASPPKLCDVMQLTAEIDFRARTSGRRCFGPRMTKILESVQQFASIGDVIIGGSQNLIACGVWSLVRLALLTAARSSAYLESLSSLLMAVGPSAPRYQEMVALHPKSRALTTLGLEYFILVVRLCHEVIIVCNKSTISQLQMFSRNLGLEAFRSDLLNCSKAINEQLNLEEARENSTTRELMNTFSSTESRRRRLETWLNLLKACSEFDYQTPWKQARKCGDVTWLDQNVDYTEWRDSETPSTLLLLGKLGAGKTVLLANVVDHMNIHPGRRVGRPIVAYFFCRADDQESRKPRTVMGCLARQMLETCEASTVKKLWKGTRPTMNEEDIRDLFNSETIKGQNMCFILDGIDDCTSDDRKEIIDFLLYLQTRVSIKLCISYRLTADSRTRRDLDCLKHKKELEMTDTNPDIEHYIQAWLESSVESGHLAIGDPTIVLEIQQALDTGAQGMFLWVTLQLQTICAQKTDDGIRRALHNLPRTLPETFSRILSDARENGWTLQSRLLRLLVAALRPLTTDELREAMSVTPYDTVWNRSKLINNVHPVLATCASLLIVDEEKATVHFVHQSVEQFLLGGFEAANEFQFTREIADQEMALIMLTYLNYNVFDTQISRVVAPSLPAQQVEEKIISSTLTPGGVRSLALHMLRARKKPNFDIGKALAAHSSQFKTSKHDAFPFYHYVSEHFLQHTMELATCSGALLSLLQASLEKHTSHVSIFEASPDLEAMVMSIMGTFYFKRQQTYKAQRSPHLALSHGHLGALRSSLRDTRSGIPYMCRLVSTLSRVSKRNIQWMCLYIRPQIMLKFLCIAATFRADRLCEDIVAYLTLRMSFHDMIRETSRIADNLMAIAFITRRKEELQ